MHGVSTVCARCVLGVQDDAGYVVVKPALGLLYPGVDSLHQLLARAAAAQAKGVLPVVLDCSSLVTVDFTAAAVRAADAAAFLVISNRDIVVGELVVLCLRLPGAYFSTK